MTIPDSPHCQRPIGYITAARQQFHGEAAAEDADCVAAVTGGFRKLNEVDVALRHRRAHSPAANNRHLKPVMRPASVICQRIALPVGLCASAHFEPFFREQCAAHSTMPHRRSERTSINVGVDSAA